MKGNVMKGPKSELWGKAQPSPSVYEAYQYWTLLCVWKLGESQVLSWFWGYLPLPEELL